MATAAAPLRVYLARHALAEERGPAWPDDRLRPLSQRGIRRFTPAARGFVGLEGAPDRIWTSPFTRAFQTAELVRAAAHVDADVEVLDALAPGQPASGVVSRLRRLKGGSRVVLVGHEPDLGLLAAHLLGAAHAVPFKKGAICRIDVTRSPKLTGTLIWFLPPGVLRRLRRRSRPTGR